MYFAKRAVLSLWVPLSLYCAGLSLYIVTVGLFVLGLYVLTCITLHLTIVCASIGSCSQMIYLQISAIRHVNFSCQDHQFCVIREKHNKERQERSAYRFD